MTIKISCPHCQQSYALADSQQGQKVRCKSCDEAFVVRGGAAGRNAPPLLRDEEDDRPAPRAPRRKKGGTPTWVWIVCGGVGVLLLLGCLGGGALIWWASGGLGNNKVTPENYSKLKPGMSEEEVKAILGEPTTTDASTIGLAGMNNTLGMRVMTWRNRNNQITLAFRGGKLVTMMSQFQNTGGARSIQQQR